MIFVCDVGNTNIVWGVYEGDTLKYHWRVATSRDKTEDELAMLIKNLLDQANLDFTDFDGVIISSVVPSIMFSLERMCIKYFRLKPLIVGPGVKTGLNIKVDNPKEIGADRIVNAVAGIHYYKAPLIIVDFGTATTFCYINEKGQYLGGAIAPGMTISTEALYEQASKLPRIELAKPDQVIGRNTISAMQSGIVFGYVGLVEGIVKRIQQEGAKKATVIATGGLAPFIAKETHIFDGIDPFLTLKGLHLLYKRNTTEKE
jgi:type III pantothenate kinase